MYFEATPFRKLVPVILWTYQFIVDIANQFKTEIAIIFQWLAPVWRMDALATSSRSGNNWFYWDRTLNGMTTATRADDSGKSMRYMFQVHPKYMHTFTPQHSPYEWHHEYEINALHAPGGVMAVNLTREFMCQTVKYR